MTNLARTANALARVVADLELPPILPGDPVPADAREMLLSGPDVSLRRGPMFYGANGDPIDLSPREAFAQLARIRGEPGGEINATLRSEKGVGVPIHVSTAYLGVDLSTAGPLPLVWETLVFIGDRVPWVLDPVRYATRAAAHAGHKAIVAAIRSAGMR